jgi:CRISPR-associated protein Cmr5
MKTRSQRLAETAYTKVRKLAQSNEEAEYRRFAKRFPALLHNCGLSQAIAFAYSKGQKDYLEHLKAVADTTDLQNTAYQVELLEYMRLSRQCLDAAGWLKHYAEALLNDPEEREEEKTEAGSV